MLKRRVMLANSGGAIITSSNRPTNHPSHQRSNCLHEETLLPILAVAVLSVVERPLEA